MRKKIRDLTREESFRICSERTTCDSCPLYVLCMEPISDEIRDYGSGRLGEMMDAEVEAK